MPISSSTYFAAFKVEFIFNSFPLLVGFKFEFKIHDKKTKPSFRNRPPCWIDSYPRLDVWPLVFSLRLRWTATLIHICWVCVSISIPPVFRFVNKGTELNKGTLSIKAIQASRRARKNIAEASPDSLFSVLEPLSGTKSRPIQVQDPLQRPFVKLITRSDNICNFCIRNRHRENWLLLLCLHSSIYQGTH